MPAPDASTLRWRPATSADARDLWGWRNDAATRAASFNGDEVPFEAHCAWLERLLQNPATRLFIITDGEGQPVGQVRFDLEGDEATVSIGLAAAARGRGLATAALRALGDTQLAAGVAALVAFVKPDNERSLRAFRGAGFTEEHSVVVQGQAAIQLVRRRESTRG